MMAGALQSLVAASFGWFLASSLWIYPHSLSYFNESIGGPLNGPKHLLGSNVDWGQDWKYLADWTRENSVHTVRCFAIYLPFNPRDLGVHIEIEQLSGTDELPDHVGPTPVLISVNLIGGEGRVPSAGQSSSAAYSTDHDGTLLPRYVEGTPAVAGYSNRLY